LGNKSLKRKHQDLLKMKQSQENDLNLRLNNSDNVANASAENQQDPLDDYTSFFK